ncbi:MAG: hypothetical protein KGN02_08210 [bacterium]|nr:hypothetical protein [bacterium]
MISASATWSQVQFSEKALSLHETALQNASYAELSLSSHVTHFPLTTGVITFTKPPSQGFAPYGVRAAFATPSTERLACSLTNVGNGSATGIRLEFMAHYLSRRNLNDTLACDSIEAPGGFTVMNSGGWFFLESLTLHSKESYSFAIGNASSNWVWVDAPLLVKLTVAGKTEVVQLHSTFSRDNAYLSPGIPSNGPSSSFRQRYTVKEASTQQPQACGLRA